MKIASFSPPANIDDFNAIPKQRDAWSEFLNFRFDLEVARMAAEFPAGTTPQFYNPARGNGAADRVVTQSRPFAFDSYKQVSAVCNSSSPVNPFSG